MCSLLSIAYFYGLPDRPQAVRLISEGKRNAEIVLTGRDLDEIFINAANYVSEIKCLILFHIKTRLEELQEKVLLIPVSCFL